MSGSAFNKPFFFLLQANKKFHSGGKYDNSLGSGDFLIATQLLDETRK